MTGLKGSAQILFLFSEIRAADSINVVIDMQGRGCELVHDI